MTDHNERVAVLEAEVCSLKDNLIQMESKLDSILDELTRYKGFLGGVAFVISSLGIFWSFAGDYIKDHFK